KPLGNNYAATAKTLLSAATPQALKRAFGPERDAKTGVPTKLTLGFHPMKLFSCQGCGQLLYFENVRCESCGRALAYLADITDISASEPLDDGNWRVLAAPHKAYKFCVNYNAGMCNWMVPADDETGFCAACRHNRTVPDPAIPGNDVLWRKIETA